MKHGLYLALISLSVWASAQRSTHNNYSGDWNSSASWTDAQATSNDENGSFIINGKITNGAALLTITGSVTVNDTLIVEGNFNMDQNGATLTVGANGVLIVLGDFDFANQLNINNNGVIAVGGTFDKDGSANQGSFTGSGKVYATSYGPVGGPGNPTTGDWIDDETGNTSQSESVTDLSGDGFSEIEEFINGGGTTPLPVDLLYFTTESNEEIKLSWATATELNNDFFSIERSEDGKYFYEIGRVAGNGDSNEVIEYEFTDKFAFAPIEYYRLKQVDFDGQFEYFQVHRVETGLAKEKNEFTAYPTIVKNGQMNLSSTKPFQIQNITFYSLSGGESKSLNEQLVQENPLNYSVNLSGLEKGIYLIKLSSSEGDQHSSRIIVE
ncbi:MAG: hypothetical protein RLN88_04410 [Ekhidna sp.]|uniref:hypothetical protein n=1 Tax=Ekhidna sp. TaxID=2608089 RepID=UPI0032EEA52E